MGAVKGMSRGCQELSRGWLEGHCIKRVSKSCQDSATVPSGRRHWAPSTCEEGVKSVEALLEGVKRASRGSKEGVKRELREC